MTAILTASSPAANVDELARRAAAAAYYRCEEAAERTAMTELMNIFRCGVHARQGPLSCARLPVRPTPRNSLDIASRMRCGDPADDVPARTSASGRSGT